MYENHTLNSLIKMTNYLNKYLYKRKLLRNIIKMRDSITLCAKHEIQNSKLALLGWNTLYNKMSGPHHTIKN